MIWRYLQVLFIGLAVHGVSIAAALHQESGFLDRAVTVGGVEYRYQVYVPRDYDSKRVADHIGLTWRGRIWFRWHPAHGRRAGEGHPPAQ